MLKMNVNISLFCKVKTVWVTRDQYPKRSFQSTLDPSQKVKKSTDTYTRLQDRVQETSPVPHF